MLTGEVKMGDSFPSPLEALAALTTRLLAGGARPVTLSQPLPEGL